MTKNFILGGGIAGLIWGFYNKDYTIISPETGGQFNAPFSLGPRYLEVTNYTKKLLSDLKIKSKIKTIKIGFYKGRFINQNQNFRNQYFKKSRGINDKNKDKTSMNNNKNELKIFDVDFKIIIEKIKQSLNKKIINCSIKRINQEYKCLYISNNQTINYSKIISTIPLNIFHKMLLKEKGKYMAKDITYVLLKEQFFDMKYFNFVYILDGKMHRITKTEKGLVCDWLGKHSKKECKDEFKKFYLNSYVLKNAQIITTNRPMKQKDIIFSGRYGAWDRSYKVEKVIKEAIEYARKNRVE